MISYLNEFRILLIIDNLETVLDKRILDFFGKLNGRSKILVTSRLGTGEMNYRFPLAGLSEADSVQLLRSTAKVRRVPDIVKAKNDILQTYCRKMKFNPGFIKWFVSTVQCGTRPEDALVKPFGFIYADNGTDYFFHQSNLHSGVTLDVLRPGLRVMFKLGRNKQGVTATEVRIVN